MWCVCDRVISIALDFEYMANSPIELLLYLKIECTIILSCLSALEEEHWGLCNTMFVMEYVQLSWI